MESRHWQWGWEAQGEALRVLLGLEWQDVGGGQLHTEEEKEESEEADSNISTWSDSSPFFNVLRVSYTEHCVMSILPDVWVWLKVSKYM